MEMILALRGMSLFLKLMVVRDGIVWKLLWCLIPGVGGGILIFWCMWHVAIGKMQDKITHSIQILFRYV